MSSTTRKRPLNHWVAHVHDQWLLATLVWERDAEAASNGWATELAEFEAAHPRPRFKDFLVGLSHPREEAA